MHSIHIKATPHGSRLIASDIHTAWHIDVPIAPDDLRTLITAAAKSPDENKRVELSGTLADRTAEGVRVRQVANNSHFDIPWPMVVRGIK